VVKLRNGEARNCPTLKARGERVGVGGLNEWPESCRLDPKRSRKAGRQKGDEEVKVQARLE
jgi:hypothetical protein